MCGIVGILGTEPVAGSIVAALRRVRLSEAQNALSDRVVPLCVERNISRSLVV
jgi:hypothetical protein